MAWKTKIDPMIKSHLDKQVKETLKYRNAFMSAKNPADAQIWCAVAELSRQLFDVNLKLTYLERALIDIGKTKEAKEVLTKKNNSRIKTK